MNIAFSEIPVSRDSQSVLKLSEDYQLGFRNATGEFSPCRLSLSPYAITDLQWLQLMRRSRALSVLLDKVSKDIAFLTQVFQEFQQSQSLTGHLYRLLVSESETPLKATAVNLIRHDFLLDESSEWILVESNAIAAGMGPFCEVLGSLQKKFWQVFGVKKKWALIDNPAVTEQSRILFTAAQQIAGNRKPRVVFVVEPLEDNVYDQTMLAQALQKRGAEVEFRTFAQMDGELIESEHQRLALKTIGNVDLFYFRTGYNEQDYISQDNRSTSFWSLRQKIERHHVAVCPSVAMQLAASKRMQYVLAQFSEQEFENRWQLTSQESRLIKKTLNIGYQSVIEHAQIVEKLQSGRWLLKSLGEGGGNVLQQIDTEKFFMIPEGAFLMERINSQQGNEKLLAYDGHQMVNVDRPVSEVGVFIAGDEHEYSGYLVRSKPRESLESGVHKGDGFLNTLFLKNDSLQ